MSEIRYRTRLIEDMFRGLVPWMARLLGGLAPTNILDCMVFASALRHGGGAAMANIPHFAMMKAASGRQGLSRQPNWPMVGS